jgi:uncharacterized protein YigE (DUF2233 family)
MSISTVLKAVVVVAASALGGTASGAEPTGALACRTATVKATRYVICSIDSSIARPRLFWKNADGHPYRTFANLARAVADEGKFLTFAMNAGMYADDFTPIGLHVENGKELRPANRIEIRPGAGIVPNFYKKPNGVFFLDDKGAGILPTAVFLKRRGEAAFATQSGPMLVIDGKSNPIFIPGSKDRTRRSGVGICEGGVVRFAISDDPVNFFDFAQLFRDDLACLDALFLDGGRGAGIYLPALGREDWSGHGGYGPIVGLVE